MKLTALILDVDGTLAETETTHLKAVNGAFESMDLSWRWSRSLYRELLATAGGRARILRFLVENCPGENREGLEYLAVRLHAEKDRRYRASLEAGEIRLRPGAERLIREARSAGLALAVATATGRKNFEMLLRHAGGPESSGWFDVVCTGGDAARHKPAPDIYLQVLAKLGLPAGACVAIEDSNLGVASARGAGLPVVVTESSFTTEEAFVGATAVLSDLGEPDQAMKVLRGSAFGKRLVDVELLRRWHQEATNRIPAR